LPNYWRVWVRSLLQHQHHWSYRSASAPLPSYPPSVPIRLPDDVIPTVAHKRRVHDIRRSLPAVQTYISAACHSAREHRFPIAKLLADCSSIQLSRGQEIILTSDSNDECGPWCPPRGQLRSSEPNDAGTSRDCYHLTLTAFPLRSLDGLSAVVNELSSFTWSRSFAGSVKSLDSFLFGLVIDSR
jgi:hypothetical protein